MGVDAGFGAPGIAIVEVTNETTLIGSRVVELFCCVTTRDQDRDYVIYDDACRIRAVADLFNDVLRKYTPDLAVVELPHGGAKSALAIKGMAYASAIAITTFHTRRIRTAYLNPYTNKRASTGDHQADKEMVICGVVSRWESIPWIPKVYKKKKPALISPDSQKQEACADALSAVIAYVEADGNPEKVVLVEY